MDNKQGEAAKAQANRINQCNRTDRSTGPGHDAKYGGKGTKTDLNNKSNQQNPQHQGVGKEASK
jgi:hypothetical protein